MPGAMRARGGRDGVGCRTSARFGLPPPAGLGQHPRRGRMGAAPARAEEAGHAVRDGDRPDPRAVRRGAHLRDRGRPRAGALLRHLAGDLDGRDRDRAGRLLAGQRAGGPRGRAPAPRRAGRRAPGARRDGGAGGAVADGAGPRLRRGRAGDGGHAARRRRGLPPRLGARQPALAAAGQAGGRGTAGAGGLVAGAGAGGGLLGRDRGRDRGRLRRPPARGLGCDLLGVRRGSTAVRAVPAGRYAGRRAGRRWEGDGGPRVGPGARRGDLAGGARGGGEPARRSGVPPRVRPVVHRRGGAGRRGSTSSPTAPGRRPSGSGRTRRRAGS